MKNHKYIFVTGGVMSGVGKGVAASSIGAVFKARGFNVTMIKIDPYINVDAGTMNPTEHGEVFVLEDGDETDQDMGNYERFLGLGHEARGLVACRQAIARQRELAVGRLDVRKEERDAGVGDRALGADALVAAGACTGVLDGRRNGGAHVLGGGRERMRALRDGGLLCRREAVGVLAPDAQRSVRPIQVEYEHRGPMRRTVVRTRGVGAAVQ
jgi:hypothetical protein